MFIVHPPFEEKIGTWSMSRRSKQTRRGKFEFLRLFKARKLEFCDRLSVQSAQFWMVGLDRVTTDTPSFPNLCNAWATCHDAQNQVIGHPDNLFPSWTPGSSGLWSTMLYAAPSSGAFRSTTMRYAVCSMHAPLWSPQKHCTIIYCTQIWSTPQVRLSCPTVSFL